MAYCGILDNLLELDGKPVDFSRLDEGIIIAGDEQYDADEFITDEERLDLFNESTIRTKAGLLEDINSLLAEIEEDSKTDTKHSAAFYERYRELVIRFRAEVEKNTFPEKLEDWWEYNYDVRGTGITLTLSHTECFDVSANDTCGGIIDTQFELLHIRTKLLTVEQYAQSYGVTTTAVRQWIRRGKIRSAIKEGSEWRIPELAEVTERGYKHATFTRNEFLTDLPDEYAFFNDYDYVDIDQNEEHKELFDLCFGKVHDSKEYPVPEQDQKYKHIQLDQKEREKFELYLISNPFIESRDTCITVR